MDPWSIAAILGALAAFLGWRKATSSSSTPTTPTAPAVPVPPAPVPTSPTPAVQPTPAPTPLPVPPPASTPPVVVPQPPPPQNPTPPPPAATGSIVVSGGNMLGGSRVDSPSSAYQLNYQMDGNLVLYGPAPGGGGVPVWASNTAGRSVGQVAMNVGGNLIIYDAGGNVVWTSGTDGNPGAFLSVNDNGTITVQDPGLTPPNGTLWTGGTPISTPAPPPTPSGGTGPAPITALPGAPGRDALCRVHAAFNGDVSVTTPELGTVPSWGPEIGLLSASSRQTTYAAHRAWGATHFCVAIAGNYQEGGVVYPNNTAENNNWFGALPTLVNILIEIIGAGMWPVLFLDGDDGFSQIYNNLPAVVQAIRTSPIGDLTPYLVYCSGFDSIDEIGLGQYHDNGATEDALFVYIRSIIGDDAVQAKENAYNNPPMWVIPPSPGSTAVDVFLQEFASLALGNQQAPKIIAGTWDAEHNDYAPTYNVPAGNEVPWTQSWQVCKRLLAAWSPPADEPFNILVPVTGGANAGTNQPVSADSQGAGGQWLASGTPRGRQYVIAFEFGTYAMTHGQATAEQVQTTRAYLDTWGFDGVC
jgi:hypothetical protein